MDRAKDGTTGENAVGDEEREMSSSYDEQLRSSEASREGNSAVSVGERVTDIQQEIEMEPQQVKTETTVKAEELIQREKNSCRRGLFPLFCRLEHESLSSDFDALFRRYPAFITGFLLDVEKELELYMIKHSCRSSSAEILSAFRYLSSHLGSGISSAFFSDPGNAWPMEVLFLVCQFFAKAECPDERVKKGPLLYNNMVATIRAKGGIIALGKGVFAGLAVSMAEEKEDLPRATAEMYVAAFDVGMAHRTNLRTTYAMEGTQPFAVFIVGISVFTIGLLLKKLNRGSVLRGSYSPPAALLEPTMIFSYRSFVISGHPKDIARLKVLLTEFAAFSGIRMKLLDIPQHYPQNHSQLSRSTYYELLWRWNTEGVVLDPQRLKLTVFSPVTGEKWNNESESKEFRDIQQEIAFALMGNHMIFFPLQHVDVHNDLIAAVGGEMNGYDLISWGMDYKAFELWETNGMKYSDGEAQLRHSFLFTPKRNSSDAVVRKTLDHLSVINQVWRKAYPDSDLMLEVDTPLRKMDQQKRSECTEMLSVEVLSAFFDESMDRRQYDHDDSAHECIKFIELLQHEVPVQLSWLIYAPNVKVIMELWDVTVFLKD